MGSFGKPKALKTNGGSAEGRSVSRARACEMLTQREACELLKVSRTTLWRWIKAKKIAIIRLGTATKPLIRIHVSELQKVVIEGHVSFE